MSCDQVAGVLQQYLDAELSPAQVPEVLAHLEKCRDCGLEADVYRNIKSNLIRFRQTADPGAMERLQSFASQISSQGDG